MAITIASEVIFTPMFLRCMQFQPVNGTGIDISHSLDGNIEFVLRYCPGSVVEVFSKLRVLVFLVHILIQMSQAIAMWRTGEQQLDGLKETLLAVGHKSETTRNQESWCMHLNNVVEDGSEPMPIVVIFNSDDSVSQGKQGTV